MNKLICWAQTLYKETHLGRQSQSLNISSINFKSLDKSRLSSNKALTSFITIILLNQNMGMRDKGKTVNKNSQASYNRQSLKKLNAPSNVYPIEINKNKRFRRVVNHPNYPTFVCLWFWYMLWWLGRNHIASTKFSYYHSFARFIKWNELLDCS